jgi:threonylcarbamoyladenosine tRNA methylthiotransferase MtaB
MKVFLESIGCRLNQSEIENLADQFRSAGYDIVGSADAADLVVVNTCTVTAKAASDSRQKIRQARHAGTGCIAVTGCWATLEPSVAASMPGVKWIIPNQRKDQLVYQVTGMPEADSSQPIPTRQALPGEQFRTRAFIKVQDGCDHHCTYCITRLARGASRSRAAGQVLADIKAALRGGAKEVVLTGVQLGSWGHDLDGSHHLADLLGLILNQTETPRLRLSSIEPWEVDEFLLDVWRSPRMCRHLHLPLQSGSKLVLQRMARGISPSAYSLLLELIRSQVPEMAITTDIMVGFPGEGENEFAESLDFITSMGFSGGHVFKYSARPGTPAASYPDQVPHPVRKMRSELVRRILMESGMVYRHKFLGQTLPVLWEAREKWIPGGIVLSGLTDNYLRVETLSSRELCGQVSQVILDEVLPGGLRGELVSEPARPRKY